jgi:hypothetical protein
VGIGDGKQRSPTHRRWESSEDGGNGNEREGEAHGEKSREASARAVFAAAALSSNAPDGAKVVLRVGTGDRVAHGSRGQTAVFT